MIREAIDYSEWPGDEASVDHSDDGDYILLETGSLCLKDADWRNQAEKGVRQLFFHLTESLKQSSSEVKKEV